MMCQTEEDFLLLHVCYAVIPSRCGPELSALQHSRQVTCDWSVAAIWRLLWVVCYVTVVLGWLSMDDDPQGTVVVDVRFLLRSGRLLSPFCGPATYLPDISTPVDGLS
jgi:hypothetical protein